MSGAFGFIELVAETEAWLQRELELEPVPLAADLARAEGEFKGRPIAIETRAYRGSILRYARFACITGGDLEIGNVLCLGRPELALPILGADLVALSGDTGMIAVDLSPTLPEGAARDRQLAPLAAKRAARPALPPGGELPRWCAEWFSPHALYSRFDRAARLEASAAYRDFPHAFAEIARVSTPSAGVQAEAVARAEAQYLADHRTEDKGLKMLEKLFGAAWAARYLTTVLFPAETA